MPGLDTGAGDEARAAYYHRVCAQPDSWPARPVFFSQSATLLLLYYVHGEPAPRCQPESRDVWSVPSSSSVFQPVPGPARAVLQTVLVSVLSTGSPPPSSFPVPRGVNSTFPFPGSHALLLSDVESLDSSQDQVHHPLYGWRRAMVHVRGIMACQVWNSGRYRGIQRGDGGQGKLERSGLSVSLHAPLHAHAPLPVVECTPSFAGLLVLSQHG